MLVPSADKKTITMILQMNDSNDTQYLYISSKNLVMFTLRNCGNNRYTTFTTLKLCSRNFGNVS